MAAEQGYGGQYAQQYQGAQEEYNVVDTSENFPYYFCEKVAEPRDESEEAVEAADASWDELRDWIRSHTKEEVRAAIEARDYAGYTALHWACQKVPPVDVIDAFISVGPHITGWPDNDELLPIHHAALFGADTSVITSLVEAFPGSKSRTDRRGRTPLHCACEKSYPNSVLVVDLLSFTTSDSDSFENVCVAESVDVSGQLPIHVACSIGANPQVIQSLVEAFPESTTKTDNRGQTPLHCACQVSSPVSPVLVALLSSTGAASYADESNGCLPIHYACAFGASEETLYVLADAYKEGITSMDKNGRTPLHYVLVNARNKSAPAAVRVLLSLNKDLVNPVGGSPNPIYVLADYAATVQQLEVEERETTQACLKHLLAANPDPTADFFTALQSLPRYLQERAVVTKEVQELLNEKITMRFPTFILMMDFYVQVLIAFCYAFAVQKCLDDKEPNIVDIVVLWAGASYFLVRELIEIMSLAALRALKIYLFEPSNWLNATYIVLIYVWTNLMHIQRGQVHRIRMGLAVTVLIIWVRFLAFLRNMLIDFAVFIDGVLHVIRRLVAFLICLIIILVAFSRMMFTLYYRSDYCETNNPWITKYTNSTNSTEYLADLQCDRLEKHHWCTSWDSFLAIYTQLLGEVDVTVFGKKKFAIILFAIFMFLAVILLANVLIAIVTDSYKTIQNERAAIIFWTKRLDFIAEMDAIANGPWKEKFCKTMRIGKGSEKATFGKKLWDNLMDLFKDDQLDDGLPFFESIIHMCLRFLTMAFIIPAWVFLGIVTMGILWPPQIREFIFSSPVSKGITEEADEIRKTQTLKLKNEIEVLKEGVMRDLAIDRTSVVQIQGLVADRKLEIQREMKQIKRIMENMFEQQGS